MTILALSKFAATTSDLSRCEDLDKYPEIRKRLCSISAIEVETDKDGKPIYQIVCATPELPDTAQHTYSKEDFALAFIGDAEEEFIGFHAPPALTIALYAASEALYPYERIK